MPRGPFKTLCLGLCQKGNVEDLEIFCRLAWSIWLERTKLVHERLQNDYKASIERAGRILGEFQSCSNIEDRGVVHEPRLVGGWEPPPTGTIKINVDAAVKQNMNIVGIGVVIRDDQGCVLAASTKIVHGSLSPQLGECLAVKEGARFGMDCGFQNWII